MLGASVMKEFIIYTKGVSDSTFHELFNGSVPIRQKNIQN